MEKYMVNYSNHQLKILGFVLLIMILSITCFGEEGSKTDAETSGNGSGNYEKLAYDEKSEVGLDTNGFYLSTHYGMIFNPLEKAKDLGFISNVGFGYEFLIKGNKGDFPFRVGIAAGYGFHEREYLDTMKWHQIPIALDVSINVPIIKIFSISGGIKGGALISVLEASSKTFKTTDQFLGTYFTFLFDLVEKVSLYVADDFYGIYSGSEIIGQVNPVLGGFFRL